MHFTKKICIDSVLGYMGPSDHGSKWEHQKWHAGFWECVYVWTKIQDTFDRKCPFADDMSIYYGYPSYNRMCVTQSPLQISLPQFTKSWLPSTIYCYDLIYVLPFRRVHFRWFMNSIGHSSSGRRLSLGHVLWTAALSLEIEPIVSHRVE